VYTNSVPVHPATSRPCRPLLRPPLSLIPRHPPTPTLFPYTTLFRSAGGHPRHACGPRHRHRPRRHDQPRGRGGPRHGPPLRLRRSEEHTSELQSLRHLVCRLLLEKKKTKNEPTIAPPARNSLVVPIT